MKMRRFRQTHPIVRSSLESDFAGGQGAFSLCHVIYPSSHYGSNLTKIDACGSRSYGDTFPRVSERSAAERVSERTGAAERMSERTSGLFFTASFQTDLSHRPSNSPSKRNHFQITRHSSTFLNYFSIHLNGTMSRISVKIDAFSLAKSVRDIGDSFVW